MYMIFNKVENKPVAFLNTQEQVNKYMERFDNDIDYDVIKYKGIEDCEQKQIGEVVGEHGMLTFIGGTDSWDAEKFKGNKYLDMDSKAVCISFNTVYGLSNKPSDDAKGHTVYKAYIADKDTSIPEFYNKVAEFNDWVRVIGNIGPPVKFKAKKINVYRVDGFDCVIQLIN